MCVCPAIVWCIEKVLLISNELSTLYTDSAKVKKGAWISTHTIIYQLVIVSTTKFRNDTLSAVKYVAGAVLLSQLEKFLNLVTHNESVHCGIYILWNFPTSA